MLANASKYRYNIEKRRRYYGKYIRCPSSAIQMLYSQIVLKKGMPFELKLPSSKPDAVGVMTREQLDAELQKGVDSIKEGKVYSADEVDAALAKEFGI